MTLLNGYFSLYVSHKILKTKYISKLFIRRSSRRIFIGKGELKHTSNKVIITFYVYNTEKISLKSDFINLYKSLYSPKKAYVKKIQNMNILTFLNEPLKKTITLDNSGNILKDADGDEIIKYNRPYTIKEFLDSPKDSTTNISIDYTKKEENYIEEIKETKQITFYDAYSYIVESFINETSLCLKALNKYFEYLTNLVEIKVLNNREKYLIYMNIVNTFNTYSYPSYNYYKNIAEKKYMDSLYKLRYLLKLNTIKFEKPFILRLTNLVENLYNKKVEFNIVNLKKVHLSSDILTQAIAVKRKIKRINIYNLLISSLGNVRLPSNRFSDKVYEFKKDEVLFNKIRNTYINDMLNNEAIKTDPLNRLLLNYFPWGNKLEDKGLSKKHSISLRDYVLKYLKHSKLNGVRLEAKGRLSRRYKASRAVFKLYWKGGLKNVDSSFKGIPSVMLRGHATSNVEYSKLNSKTRIGAYGLKGWVSSK